MALKDVKKMCSKFCNGNSSNIVGYTPPTLHKGVRWFVDFTSLDPARGLMRRKRYYIKDSLSVSEKKRRASEIMDVLTKQLAQGWNPWVTDDESRGFVYFDNCLERYLDYVDRMDRKKAFKTRYEKHGEHKPDFREIIEDLCDNNVELADEIFEILNTAVSIDTSIRNFRSRNKFYDGKVGISVENINKLVSGPVYYGQSYDYFITSSISFKSEELNNIFFNEVILSFEDPIYFTSGSFERLEVKDESLAYLNKMIIFKSNAIDMVKLPTGAYMLCVDVHKRFKDGDLIKTDSSWIFSQNYSRFSAVIIN